MTEDERIVLALFRKLLDDPLTYIGTGTRAESPRLCVDGTIWDVTREEIDAFDRWLDQVTDTSAAHLSE